MKERDYKWLIGILLGVAALLLLVIFWVISVRFSDNVIMVNVVSIGTGLVSMALGAVAILMSLFQNNSSKNLNDRMQSTIDRMDEKVNSVRDSVNKFDSNSIKKTVSDGFKELETELLKSFEEDQTLKSKLSELSTITSEKINTAIKEARRAFDEDELINHNDSNKAKKTGKTRYSLDIKRDFGRISQEFREGNFSLQTVSRLIEIIRLYRKNLTPETASILLEIPINVLENDVELKNSEKWVKENSDYFAGNITWVDSDFLIDMKKKFYEGKFDLNTIIKLTRHVKDNFEELWSASEFLLRNTEVTIRDDVEISKYSNFSHSGNTFANQIDSALSI